MESNERLSNPQQIREHGRTALALSHKQTFSLYKKSQNFNIPFDTLKEVYERGYAVNFSEQEGFNRVNSFIAGGAATEMDKDLIEKRGLWDNINAKRKRGERMRKPGEKGAPTDAAFRASQTEESDPCWNGYKQVGMKMKGGKQVPNCVPEAANAAQQAAIAIAMKKAGKKPQNEELEEKYGKGYVSPAEKIKKAMAARGVNIDSDKHRQEHERIKAKHQAILDKEKVKEEYTGTEKTSSNINDPTNRLAGTDSLVNNYKNATPGQSSTLSTVKKVVREQIEINECANGKCACSRNMEEDAKGYKNPTGGLTQKGRDHYNRETGGHLKAPVTTPPSKLKKGSKAANRRKSFCARMSGVEGPMKKPNGEPTRKALALRKWNC